MCICWEKFTSLIGCLLLLACHNTDKHDVPLLTALPPEQTGVHFSNQLFEDEQLNIITFEYFYNGAGVAIGDIDNDGLQDLFFTGNMVASKLYLNRGDMSFQDITESAGIDTRDKWATGVSMVDLNSDGWLDIYVCFSGPYQAASRANQLYLNNQDGTFTEQAAALGLADEGHTTHAAFFDYDRDGDLDVYLLTNIMGRIGPNVIRPKQVQGEAASTDRLYRNDNGVFQEVSAQANILKEGYGLGVAIRDFNRDGWPDIYVSNDYLSNDLLYLNNQDGTFTDRAEQYFQHTSYSAMGNDIADINHDGLEEVIALDMLPPQNERKKLMINSINYDRHRSEILTGYTPQYMRNTLQLHQGFDQAGDPVYSEVGQLAGIHQTDWSWAALLIDLDQDSNRDLVITNGYPRDITNLDFVAYKMAELTQASYNEQMKSAFIEVINEIEGAYVSNYVYQNKGNLQFIDQSAEWGFTQPSYSHGAAYGDLDNDGDLDLVINNTQDPAFIFENQAQQDTTAHYLRIKLLGSTGNTLGLGTKIHIYHDSTTQYIEHSLYRGFQSSQEPFVHYGLGASAQIDSLIIIWPDSQITRQYNISSNQTLTLSQNQAKTANAPITVRDSSEHLLSVIKENLGLTYQHRESHYADFKIQPLLPHKFSQSGPGMAIADINNDQLDDLVIGGAFNQRIQLFLQQSNGEFEQDSISQPIKYEEDMGLLVFDANGDGWNDIYAVSGGNEFEAGSPYYRDRLYLNQQNGTFQWDSTALPPLSTSSPCVAGHDIDKDGDIDLFVGGKLTPQQYPQPGRSVILENQEGKFVDITEDLCPELSNIGMVNTALWSDVNNDGTRDLILAGEWMPITIFLYQDGKLINATREASYHVANDISHALTQTVGWWNSIQGADFDRDGDTDYVLGNLGLNSPLKTSSEEPVRLYVNDFNSDGKQDAVLCHYIDSKEYPFHPKDDLVKQVNSLRKTLPSYTDYATATWKEIFPKDILEHATVYEVDLFESVYLENNGNLNFVLTPLPLPAQFAPIFGIETFDINGDNYRDILLTGNSFATETMTGRYDAFKGLVLLGNGLGQFNPLSISESGFYIPGDAKSLAILANPTQPVFISTTNDGPLYTFSFTKAPIGKWVSVTDDVTQAFLTHADDAVEKIEFYLGAGYLSQSTRKLWVPSYVKDVQLITPKGKTSPTLP